MSNFISGNTIRVTVDFSDWEGQTVDPAMVNFTLYNAGWVKIKEASIGSANRLATGKYFYDWVAEEPGLYYYEFCGEIGGLPSLKRASIDVKKVNYPF